jgi:hypothetical protein
LFDAALLALVKQTSTFGSDDAYTAYDEQPIQHSFQKGGLRRGLKAPRFPT